MAEHPQANIFHSPEMFQLYAQANGYRPTLWAAVDGDGRPLALLLPVQVTLMGGLARWLTTRAVAYGSVLSVPGAEGDRALDVLLQAYSEGAEGTPLFTELRNLSDLSPVQSILVRHGYLYEDHLNYLIDLDRSPEEVLQSFGRRTRKKIRRALRQGEVVIRTAERREDIAICYDLLCRSYAAAQVPLSDQSLFEATFDVLHARGMVKFLLAWIGTDCVAASVELIFKDTIYGWYSGVDRDYSAYIPNELLMWHILEWGAENGYRLYDFGGAGKPDEEYGVRDFKSKFGGELVSYGRNVHVHAPFVFQASKAVYQVARRFNVL